MKLMLKEGCGFFKRKIRENETNRGVV
jgi:hypothetical protein